MRSLRSPRATCVKFADMSAVRVQHRVPAAPGVNNGAVEDEPGAAVAALEDVHVAPAPGEVAGDAILAGGNAVVGNVVGLRVGAIAVDLDVGVAEEVLGAFQVREAHHHVLGELVGVAP